MIEPLFFILIFLVVYSYAVYPLILVVLSILRPWKIVSDNHTPSISLIISAFNEEAVIGRKLDNTLGLDYPKTQLEILVVSDNSTDNTEEIVQNFADRNVILLALPVRMGKSAGLNHAVRRAKGEIIVFSDANAIYEQHALKQIVRFFADPHVGLVTGGTRYVADGHGKMVESSTIYTQLELFIKTLESRIGSCVGADGAIFAVRKSLYPPLADDDINDLVIPLKVVRQGYRAVLHKDLFCKEKISPDARGAFRRQIRITNRTLRGIFRNTELINPFKYPMFSFQLVSHKIIRFCTPFFLILLLSVNTLIMSYGIIYGLLFAGQLSLYMAAVIGLWQEKKGKGSSNFCLFYHCVMVHASILVGWFRFFTGQKDVIWNS